MTTALPRHVVEDRRGRAVLMRGGTVGDSRGGSGWSRVTVDDRAGGLPWLFGCAAPVGLGPATPGVWDRRGVAASPWSLRRVPGDACAAAGDGVAAAGLCGRGDRRGVAGPRRRAWAPLDRGGAGGSRGDGAGLAARGGWPVGSGPGAVVAGGSPCWCGRRCAGGAGLPVAGSAGRVGCCDCGGDGPVRAVRGARCGDGVAGRGGVFGWSASGARVARGRWVAIGNTSCP
jgi:hypothetical protein